MAITTAMKMAWTILVHVVKVSVLVDFILRRAIELIPMKTGLRKRKNKVT